MRPLLDYLRWKLFDLLAWRFPPEPPSEQELIAYGAEQERHKPNPLKDPAYVAMIRTQHIQAVNAETARELQRHLDEKRQQSGPYEPPEKHTDRISQVEIHRAILHGYHLRRVETWEMPAAFPTADTDKFLI